MRYLWCVIFFLGLLSTEVFAQPDTLDVNSGTMPQAAPMEELLGRLPVRQDSRITDLLVRHTQLNQRKKGIDGFRLEIYFSSESKARERAMRVKNEFNLMFPELPAYVSFQTPNFKVRIGDFRNKSEALKAKASIASRYPNAFIVKDMVRFPELFTQRIEQTEEQ